MTALLGIPLGPSGSGRERYALAMALYSAGRVSAAQLEAYRVAAAHDRLPPDLFLADRNLPIPDGDTA
jgi:hypothetical protein